MPVAVVPDDFLKIKADGILLVMHWSRTVPDKIVSEVTQNYYHNVWYRRAPNSEPSLVVLGQANSRKWKFDSVIFFSNERYLWNLVTLALLAAENYSINSVIMPICGFEHYIGFFDNVIKTIHLAVHGYYFDLFRKMDIILTVENDEQVRCGREILRLNPNQISRTVDPQHWDYRKFPKKNIW